MNTKQLNEEYHYKSGFAAKENLDTLAAAGWTFAKVTLFHSHLYYDHELLQLHRQMVRLMATGNSPYDTYLEFCQRLMLAVDFITRYREGVLCTSAIQWFRPTFTDGFARTGPMYERLLQKREQDPLWKKQWKVLAEAILDITEGHSQEKFEYWITWFKKRRARYELFIFVRAIEYQTFKSVYDEDLF